MENNDLSKTSLLFQDCINSSGLIMSLYNSHILLIYLREFLNFSFLYQVIFKSHLVTFSFIIFN